MTQELIADMLGVRREGVTDSAGKLQKARRDHLQSRDDQGARPTSAGTAFPCECYGVGEEGDRPAAAVPVPAH